MKHRGLWQPLLHTDGTMVEREPIRLEHKPIPLVRSERTDEELAEWFARTFVEWPETREEKAEPSVARQGQVCPPAADHTTRKPAL